MPRTTTATGTGGRRMDLRALGFAGARRRELLEAADRELDTIADELLEAGAHANIKTAATVSGIARTTLYRRLEARRRVPREQRRPAGLDVEASDCASCGDAYRAAGSSYCRDCLTPEAPTAPPRVA